MNMESMYKLQDMCCKELDKLAQRQELSSAALQQAGMLIATVKDIRKIEMMCEDDPEYSQTGSSYRGSYARGRSYGRYSRQGVAYGRDSMGRDSMGRYSREGNREDMIQRLEKMMYQSADPTEAEAYKRAMENLQRV